MRLKALLGSRLTWTWTQSTENDTALGSTKVHTVFVYNNTTFELKVYKPWQREGFYVIIPLIHFLGAPTTIGRLGTLDSFSDRFEPVWFFDENDPNGPMLDELLDDLTLKMTKVATLCLDASKPSKGQHGLMPACDSCINQPSCLAAPRRITA